MSRFFLSVQSWVKTEIRLFPLPQRCIFDGECWTDDNIKRKLDEKNDDEKDTGKGFSNKHKDTL